MQKVKGVAMANTVADIDPAKFAAELKELAANVKPKKALTKEQIIASDEVWEVVTDMKDNRGMTYHQIAEVFNAKGWNTSGQSIGQMIRKVREAKGGSAADVKKGGKSKTTRHRSPAASSESSKSEAPQPAKSTGAAAADAGGEGKPATTTGASRKPTMAANIDPSDL